MINFTVVLFAALAASIVNASPISFSNAVPSAPTIEAGTRPVSTPTGSPVHSKISEVHDHCEDPGDDGPPYPPASGSAKLPHPESGTVSGSNSVADNQQVMKGRGLDAAAEPEWAAHYQQYRTSHGLDAADSDTIMKGESGEYENDGQTSRDLGHHLHLRHQEREGSDCSIAAGGVSCRVKQDAEPVLYHEVSVVEPDIPTHIANID